MAAAKRSRLVCIGAAALAVLPGPAGAATITPNTTLDEFNSDPTRCSLREALQAAQDDSVTMAPGCTAGGSPSDTIQLAPGTYELSVDGTPGAANESGDLNFNATIEIEALPGGPVVIDANGIDRVFAFSGSLVLRGVSLTGGFVDSPGPMSGTTGGGIFASGGSALTISDGAIFGNRADSLGGGILAAGPLSLTDVTVSGNVTTEIGGSGIAVIGASGSVSLDHVTITDNRSEHDNMAQSLVAGGIYSGPLTTTVHNSIIAGNTIASTFFDTPDCQGTFASTGGNVIGDTSGCAFPSMVSDSLDQPALLGPFADNGGASQTHALLTGSPALDRGVASCTPADQRGYPRPFPAGGACDAGAYELFACAGAPLNQPGPFAGCPQPQAAPTPTKKKKQKCKRKKAKRRSAAAAKRCKRKKRAGG